MSSFKTSYNEKKVGLDTINHVQNTRRVARQNESQKQNIHQKHTNRLTRAVEHSCYFRSPCFQVFNVSQKKSFEIESTQPAAINQLVNKSHYCFGIVLTE